MSGTLKVRGLTIGGGIPGIIVPIVDKTRKEIIDKAETLRPMQIDMVEWRADFFDDIFDTQKVLHAAQDLRHTLGELPLLFTIRTKKEGGNKEIDTDTYTKLNTALAQSGNIDLIDVECFLGNEIVKKNIEAIHKAGVFVVGSNHDFHATPPKDEIVSRLRKMQEMGADIPKIAVMPGDMNDVLNLLAATYEMSQKYADRPIITMSMSGKGTISRLSGEHFGSSMTFGSIGQGSAPGQIPARQLAEVLGILHNAL
ncbi:MAG: type I 3-dehydroquinate dehydratase [Spirochaetes bacterium]|nr:type I 3-dehydroquinate dehydratase [Spirochaetota bacterium]